MTHSTRLLRAFTLPLIARTHLSPGGGRGPRVSAPDPTPSARADLPRRMTELEQQIPAASIYTLYTARMGPKQLDRCQNHILELVLKVEELLVDARIDRHTDPATLARITRLVDEMQVMVKIGESQEARDQYGPSLAPGY